MNAKKNLVLLGILASVLLSTTNTFSNGRWVGPAIFTGAVIGTSIAASNAAARERARERAAERRHREKLAAIRASQYPTRNQYPANNQYPVGEDYGYDE